MRVSVSFVRTWLTAVFIMVVLCTAATAQQSPPLELDDVIRMKTIQNAPVLSPDGKWIAYVVRTRPQASVTNDDEAIRIGRFHQDIGSDIFLFNHATGSERNLTGEVENNWAPSWSPDGNYLAFLSDRGGDGQPKVWVWDLRSNALKNLSDVAVRIWGAQRITWSSDSKRIFIPAIPGQLSGEDYLQGVIHGGNAPDPNTVAGSTVLLYTASSEPEKYEKRASGKTLGIDDRLRDLLMIDLATGQSTTLVSNKRISQFYVATDGSRVVYSSPQGLEKEGSQQILYDLNVLQLSSGRETAVARDVPLDFFGRFSISPDSSIISYRTNPDSQRVSDIFAVSVNGGEIRNLTHFERVAVYEPISGNWKRNFSVTPLWDSESKYIYTISWRKVWQSSIRTGNTKSVGGGDGQTVAQVVATSDNVLWTQDHGRAAALVVREELSKKEGLFGIDLVTGAVTKIVEDGRCYTCEAATDARYVAATSTATSLTYVAEDSQHPPDLWQTDFVSGETLRLTHLNPKFDQLRTGVPRLVDWLDDDGHRLQGALLLPSDYVPGRRYPLIVLVYGGVLLSGTLDRFGGYERGMPYFHPQLFATRGYAFLAPDAPQDLGTPMLDLAKTVLPGVSKLVEMGIADPERVGVMGHSYGGYSTLSLLVQTKRFKAAVEADGMADLLGMYGEMDKDGTAFGTSVETGQQLLGGSPWQVRDRYIENSPIFRFDRIETPLLIIHGGDDRAVAPFLGDEIFVALRRLGKTVSYAKYEGESHVPCSYANQLDIGQRVISWFDRYLKDRRETAAKSE
jgi:dipeptidyl aminopeptidase/acylaminoacyl peptidase